jgi:hypothetical protein
MNPFSVCKHSVLWRQRTSSRVYSASTCWIGFALRGELDHHHLNEIPGLARPSLEQIARWIWQRLAGTYSGLKRVEVRRRSARHGCVYLGAETDR